MTGEMLLGFVIGVFAEGLVLLLITMFSDFSEANIASAQTVWTQEYKKIRKVYNDTVWKIPEDHRIQLSIDEIRKIIHNKTDLNYEVDQQSTNDYVYFLRIHWYIDRFDEIGRENYQDDILITIDFRNLKRKQFIEIQKFLYEHRGLGIPTELVKKQIKAKISEGNTERD